MSLIIQSRSNPACWLLDEHELANGDILEVQRGVEWSEVRVDYHHLLREQRLFLCGPSEQSIPIIEGTRARLIKGAGR